MITVFKTNTMKNGAEYVTEVLRHVDQTDLSVMHTVIVPDRASMEAERALLKSLGGSFNVQVRTFRRFANDILPKVDYLSKQAGIMALTGIIQDKRSELCCYTKGVETPGFVADMYDVISMLKYCRIDPKQLDRKLPHSLEGKMKDISLLYSAYKQFTENRYVDSADKIDLLRMHIGSSEQVKNGYFYFYDFDNFSAQELSIVAELIKYGKGVTVACCVGENSNDKYLYLNDIYNGVMDVCREAGVVPNIVESVKFGNTYTEKIGKTLFRYADPQPMECGDFAETFCGATRVQELYALACRIRRYVEQGGRFRDVYVVTSDVTKYSNAVSTVFAEFDIPYFCDRQFCLADTAYAWFVTDYFTMCRNNFKLANVLPFVKNYLFCGDDDGVFQFENYCLKYNVSYDFSAFSLGVAEESFPAAESFRQKLFALTSAVEIPAAATASEFAATIRKLAELCSLQTKNEDFARKQEESGLLFESKVTMQAAEKLEGVLAQAEAVFGNRFLKAEDFLRILNAAVASVNISVIPTLSDCVVFANMAKARKHDVKYLALLGASYGAMPIVKTDCKLLSDGNIADLRQNGVNLEPQIFTENKRERFSLFQLLQEPEKLFVSFPSADGANSLLPSPFVGQLEEMFVRNGGTIRTESADEEVFTEKQAISKVILNKRRLQDNCPVNMPSYEVLYRKYRQTVDGFCFNKNGKEVRVENGGKLYLKNYETSVSKISDFFHCPYRFFLHYGLKVKPRPVAELKTADLGNILHAVLEMYVKDMSVAETDEATAQAAKHCFDVVMTDDFYKGLFRNPSMAGRLAQLKREAVRMCTEVKKKLAHSEFTNYAAELSFGGRADLAPVSVDFDGGKFLLIGKIDRVDVLNDKFIVIDYKSGIEASKYDEEDLYLGHKLQLLVYVKAVQDNLGLRPVGFYYFNLHNDFTVAEEQRVYTYNGRTLDDAEVACAIDTDLRGGESLTLGLKLTKTGTINRHNVGKLLTDRQLEGSTRYAMKLIADAGVKMSEGYAAISPYKGTCDYCDYCDICDFGDVLNYPQRELSENVNADIIDKIMSSDGCDDPQQFPATASDETIKTVEE